MVNRSTRKLEFTMGGVKNGVKFDEGKVPAAVQACHTVPRNGVFGDLSCLYDSIHLDYPEVGMVRLAAGTVLNSKYFVKGVAIQG